MLQVPYPVPGEPANCRLRPGEEDPRAVLHGLPGLHDQGPLRLTRLRWLLHHRHPRQAFQVRHHLGSSCLGGSCLFVVFPEHFIDNKIEVLVRNLFLFFSLQIIVYLSNLDFVLCSGFFVEFWYEYRQMSNLNSSLIMLHIVVPVPVVISPSEMKRKENIGSLVWSRRWFVWSSPDCFYLAIPI